MTEIEPVLDTMKKITPIQFENLVFDLMVLSGLKNPTWRTPGPDGGRDIEGNFIQVDFSETTFLQHWYIECKRYKETVNWPTVYEKLAYADNHHADFLMFVTTAFLSPKCKEEITKWNNEKRMPIVRYWDGTILGTIVNRHPLLLRKYTLKPINELTSNFFGRPLFDIVAKSIHAAYGQAIIAQNPEISPALELSTALVDLLFARIHSANTWSKSFYTALQIDRDIYTWCDMPTKIINDKFDSYGLRAILSAIKFYLTPTNITLNENNDYSLVVTVSQIRKSNQFESICREVCLWSNFDVSCDLPNNEIRLELRKE